jgi:hypothetical protein
MESIYFGRGEAAIHHYIPRSALEELGCFRELLLHRCKF